jgi:hypothetical protein
MVRMMKAGFAAVLAASVAFAAGASASSYEMVVVHVEGSSLKRGAVIDGNRALTLPAGSTVTLVGADGSSVTLRGPSSKAPAQLTRSRQWEQEAGKKVVEILGALLSDQRRSTKALGVVRSASSGAARPLPNEWAVDVAQSGTRCVGGDVAVLWRADAKRRARVRIRRAGGVKTATAVWPEGQEYLAINRKEFEHGQNYAIAVDGRSVEIKVNVMPDGLNSTAEQAAWMARNDCESQALTMLDRLR